MVISLSSKIQRSFPSRWCPAISAASWEIPSIRSPSEQKAQVKWSTTVCPGRLNRAASQRSARAIPTEFPTPCPRGPVVVSTPGVSWNSGCPAVRLPHWRKFLSSSRGRSYPVRWRRE
jgi:hypothetical protein